MEINGFQSGEIKEIDGIKCFVPNPIYNKLTCGENQINLLQSKASWYLGKLNALSKYLPDSKLFYSMLMFEEAKKSNEIEGTKSDLTGLGNPIKEQYDQPENILVLNYLEAFNYGNDKLKNEEFSIELIQELHRKLFKNIENPTLEPGKLKERQNWVGGSSKYDARFIPAPPEDTLRLMEDLILFINNDNEKFSDLVKIGIIHYQFETIHPFNDGNGRLGRMLIGLYLIKKGIIEHPLFISNFLSKYRQEYYFNLDSVRYKNEMEHWVRFFLNAIKEAAKDTLTILDRVMELKKNVEDKIREEFRGSSDKPIQVIQVFFRLPFMNLNYCQKELNYSIATINTILTKLVAMGIIVESTNQKRNRVYVFDEYLKLFN